MFFKKTELNLELPSELMTVMHYYEDACVMGCCGINALNLNVQRAIDGMMDYGVETAMKAQDQLDRLIALVKSHQGSVSSDQSGFGQHWARSEEALSFLENVSASLQAAIDTPPELWKKTQVS
ncbi:MAG: DUF6331 family protein [Verrucomicrobiota bacterium]